MLAALIALALSAGAHATDGSSVTVNHFSVERPVDRTRRTLEIAVQRGGCVQPGGGVVADTYAGADVRVQQNAVVVAAKTANATDGACAGVGLSDLHEVLRLPRPLGRRALISSGGKGNFDFVLVAPKGRVAVREVVDPKRHPGRAYVEPVCSAVAYAFEGVSKSRWCFY